MSKHLTRIGDKLISLDKAMRTLERVLKLRSRGLSQQEVARRFSLDRSFISRLEAIGEVRKGKRVAVVGFPVENKQQLVEICSARGLDYYLILNDSERWHLVKNNNALDFFNYVLEIITMLQEFDTIVLISSEKWYPIAEALFDLEIVFINLGPTPVSTDCRVDLERLQTVLDQIFINC
ncbi:MAG: transcriptional regulator [Deltaproteobacteria bacterium]|nr:transcriptional regulator [Deltaproteobacteria bacterium]